MIMKLWTWIKAISEGWKIFFGVVSAVGIISAASVKLNKGISIMTETATNVKFLMKSDTIQTRTINEINLKVNAQGNVQNVQEKSYIDHLKLEKRLDEIIKYYEDRAASEDEKKNLTLSQ